MSNIEKYYHKYFPTELLCQYLTKNVEDPLNQRELCFIKRNRFNRYQGGKSWSEVQAALIRGEDPERVEIGPVYNMDVHLVKKEKENVTKRMQIQSENPEMFVGQSIRMPRAIKKEFCVDIDISDYDDVRNCGCKEAKICQHCWPLMNAAIEILEELFRSAFGLKDILWVFSGRRGIHAWINDNEVMAWTKYEREAVASFVHLYEGNKFNNFDNINLKGDHPQFSLQSKVFDLAKKWFIAIGPKHGWLENDQKGGEVSNFLRFVEPGPAKSQFEKVISNRNFETSNDYEWFINQIMTKKAYSDAKKILNRMIYTFVYPRLDYQVSTHVNHLLKSPFSLHPKTGNVCVPITKDRYEDFYPDEHCPTKDGLESGNPEQIQSFNAAKSFFQSFIVS